MKYKIIKSMALATAVAAVIVACAEYPEKDAAPQPVSAAEPQMEQDVNEAVSADSPAGMAMYNGQEVEMAIQDAESAVNQAIEDGGLWTNLEELLQQARDAVAAGDINSAVEMAIAVEQYAKMSRNQAQLEQANFMLGRIKAERSDPDADMLEKIADAENAYLEDNGGQALAIVSALMAEANIGNTLPAEGQLASRARNKEILGKATAKERSRKMVASSEPVTLGGDGRGSPDKYEVLRGDNLWGISAKPTIYANPYQWPLIYKANLDQIKDPDLISPGQVLAIDRTATPADVERAVQHAKHRGAWVLGSVEASDQAYVTRERQSSVASR